MGSGLTDCLSWEAAISRDFGRMAKKHKDLAEDRKLLSNRAHTSGSNMIFCDRVEVLYDE